MKIQQLLAAAVLACVAGATSAAPAGPPRIPINPDLYEAAAEDSGYVEDVSLDGPAIRVNGSVYFFAPDAYVELRGSRSAATLIERGSNVYLRFLLLEGKRRVVYLRQVADSAPTMAR